MNDGEKNENKLNKYLIKSYPVGESMLVEFDRKLVILLAMLLARCDRLVEANTW